MQEHLGHGGSSTQCEKVIFT